MHGVLLLGEVLEQGTADAVPHHGEGPVTALPMRRGPTFSRPACLTPACPFTNIFVLTGDIGGWSRGLRRAEWFMRTQYPEGWRSLGQGIRGETQGQSRGDAS